MLDTEFLNDRSVMPLYRSRLYDEILDNPGVTPSTN